jgi:eukaryotic-like serine/threonine-protein kinase
VKVVSIAPMAYRVGRYEVHEAIASGGMAVVHLGRIVGHVGFSRTVAIKRLHPHLATDPEFVTMFLDEARLAARVQHPNVVATLDVVASRGQLFLVMEYVLGAPLSAVFRTAIEEGVTMPPDIATAIVVGALYGLHAAHEAKDEQGELLDIVHRDVSPHNLLVGLDGVTRVADFGVAKAAARLQSTRDGRVKGKIAYMAPEQLLRKNVDRRADVYAAGVVLWEALAQRRLFTAESEAGLVSAVLGGSVPMLATLRDDLPPGTDEIVLRALRADPSSRFRTAEEFAVAIERLIRPALQREVGAWVAGIAKASIEAQRRLVADVEQTPNTALDDATDNQVIEGLIGHRLTSDEAKRLASALTTTLPDSVVSVSGTHADKSVAPQAESRPRRWMWPAASVAAVLVVTGAYALRGIAGGPSSPYAIQETSSAPTSDATEAPSPAAAALDATAPSHAGTPPITHHGGVVRPGHWHPPATSPTSPPRNAPCDPPYTLDPNGVKRFKPACL